MTAIELLKQKFRLLTISETCWLLSIYKCASDEVYVQGDVSKYLTLTTPHKISLCDDADVRLAKNVRVRFFGGPKDKQAYYCGTLVTFVIDRILRVEQMCKIGFMWLMNFSRQSPENLRAQVERWVPDSLRQQMLFDVDKQDNDDIPFDSAGGNYVQIGDDIYTIHEDGAKGYIKVRSIIVPARVANSTITTDDGTVHL